MAGAREALVRLAQAHALNGFLDAVRNGRLTYLLTVQSPGPIAIRMTSGSTVPFHSTAMGKAPRAALPREEAKALLGTAPLTRITPRTVVDRRQLRAELDDVARRGSASVDGEHLPGVFSAGVVLRGANGMPLVALLVAAPGAGMEALRALAAPLLAEARTVCARLGCPDALLPAEDP